VPCVFAEGWPAVNPVSMPLGGDRTNTHTERLEEILYRIDVSPALPDVSPDNVSWGLLRRDVSMFLFGIRIFKILPGDDHISEDSLVVSVEHQNCTCSTTKKSISRIVTRIGGSELTDTEIQTVSGSPEPPKYRLPMMSCGLASKVCHWQRVSRVQFQL
jgi:hypothetical protein